MCNNECEPEPQFISLMALCNAARKDQIMMSTVPTVGWFAIYPDRNSTDKLWPKSSAARFTKRAEWLLKCAFLRQSYI